MNQEQKLERWAERELKRNIDKIILDDEEGGYIVFGRYLIDPQQHGFAVRTLDRDIHCFSSKRSAISWCIAKFQSCSSATVLFVLSVNGTCEAR